MDANPPLEKPPPRVFISYSHDSPEHCDRVLMLATRLRADGLNAQLDQFENSPPQGWPLWCARQILDSNYVLIVCTALYRDRFLGLEDFGKGRGVKWEAKVIHNILYYEEVNSGFIPVIFDPSDEEYIPETIKDASWYLVSPNGKDSSGYTQLRQRLAGDKTLSPLPLPPPSEAYRQRDDASVPTEEVWDSSRWILAAINDIKSNTEKIQSDTTKILSILEKGLPPPPTPERPHNLPPWMSTAYFIGREKELGALCAGLTAPREDALAVVQPQVVHGEGGLGKTRLAIQAVWVLYLQHQCDMAFVVSASSPAELDTQLAAVDAPSLLDLYEGEQPPRELDVRKQNVIQSLREMAGRWIVVLDAADSAEARDAVNELLRQLAGGRFLVTSRREDWPRTTVRKLPLNLFTIEEARACLLSRYWKSEPPVEEIAAFDGMATELGFLPLALVLAASYMDSRRITPVRYLTEWQQKHDTLLGFTAVDVKQAPSLLAAFKLSYDLLSPHAAHLLHMLAWLAPEPFPRRLVEDSETIREILSAGIKGSAGGDPTGALAELRTLSLLQLDDESLRLHRLVLKCARATLPENGRADVCGIALEWISSILPDAEYDETNWKLWNRLSPHLHEVIAAANGLKIASESLGVICGQLGVWLFNQARHKAAEPLMRRVVEIFERSLGKDHPNVALTLDNLAQLLQATDRLVEAEPLMQRALAITEKSYAADHPTVALRLNNLAALLQATNRLAEAAPLMRRALAIDEKSFGPDHPHVARDLSNIAALLQATDRLAEAEPLMRRALAIDEKSFGPEHPLVAIRLNNLAQLLDGTNRLAEAEPLMHRALAIDEKSYGPDHPLVAIRLNNLALLLQATNRLAEAEPLMRRALAIAEKSFGPEHLKVAIRLNNLARLLQDTNRLAEAEPLMHRAVLIFVKFKRNTGHLLPHLKTALENYRGILEAMSLGEEEIARRIAEVGKEAGLDEESYRALLAELSK